MDGCVVHNIKVHSQHNCYRLSSEDMQAIQDRGVAVKLEPGTNIVKLREGDFSYTGGTGEPAVLLWIYGGQVINKKTNVAVSATWASLNGYDDALVLEVMEPATLCAIFFDTHIPDNAGELSLSVVRI